MQLETVKVVDDSELGWKIINKSDMTKDDKIYEEAVEDKKQDKQKKKSDK